MAEIKPKRRLRRTDEVIDEEQSVVQPQDRSEATSTNQESKKNDCGISNKSLAPNDKFSATNLHRQQVSAALPSKKRSFQEFKESNYERPVQTPEQCATPNDATYQTYTTGKQSNEQESNQSSDEIDPYNELPRNKLDPFRFNQSNNDYHLRDWFSLPKEQYDSLFEHQRVGVSWLYDLYQEKKGGILGDDMGLGKTVQVATLLQGLFSSNQIKRVLVVCPATMKQYWSGELKKWTSILPEDQIQQFDDVKRNERELQMRKFKKQGGILVSSYGQVSSQALNLSEIRFDILCIDEGHKAKSQNSMLRKDLAALRVKGSRLLLSGTPLQNNLLELWSVFDLVQPKLLGKFEDFEQQFARPIESGLLKGVSQSSQTKSQILSAKLRKIYDPHFLRRTKDQIFTIRIAETSDRPLKMTELPLKTDLVVWLPLAPMQKKTL